MVSGQLSAWTVARLTTSGRRHERFGFADRALERSSWSVVPIPSRPTPSAHLFRCQDLSTSNAWAVGTFSVDRAELPDAGPALNGTNWTVVPSPSPDPTQNLLTDVDGASANDVWAIGNRGNDGYGGTTAGLVVHWNGSTWSQVNVPGTVSDGTFNVPTLQDVLAISANDVWIVGRAFSWIHFKVVPIALHWTGRPGNARS